MIEEINDSQYKIVKLTSGENIICKLVSENEKSNILNYFATGDLKSVEKMASKLVNEGYSDPWLCNILGVTHAKQKKYNLAENYFKIF